MENHHVQMQDGVVFCICLYYNIHMNICSYVGGILWRT
ncbi:MAG: hypothetical protein HPY66_0703 [Firmicutes bacterium]|nr:hypothetical protein [Bacillota bacterium]